MDQAERVFIVDDEDAILEAISRLLVQDGYDVETFSSPSLALDAAAVTPPRYLITDFLMHEMSGEELAVAMRLDLGRRCPKIVCVTGWLSELRTEQRRVFDRVLEKPFAYCDLVRLLDSLETTDTGISGTRLRAYSGPPAPSDDDTLDEALG